MNQLKHYTAIIILSVSFMLSGCSDKSKLLEKTWMVDNLKYTQQVPVEMQPQIDKTVAEMRKSFRLSYYADGTYGTETNGQVLKGKWKLNWNSSVITSTPGTGEAKEFKIMELTENKFTFKAVEGKDEVIFEMIPAK